jgi:predicted amino acid-binding ACT domain protein/phosphoserine phosphatase
MQNARLIAVYGIGQDSKGLVGRLAGAVSELGGNIVDLHQNVTHGLFSVFCLLDLPSSATIAQLQAAVDVVATETGLTLHVGGFAQARRSPERKPMLLVMLGPDRPGLIASMAQSLGRYGINIEASSTVARQGVFLMELLTDVVGCPLPEPNLRKTLSDLMAERGIRTMFQFEDVFNKKKRIIVFSFARTLLDPPALAEIVRQTGLTAEQLALPASEDAAAERCASLLEGASADLLEKAAASFTPTNESLELVQELKTLGYRVAVATSGFSYFADHIRATIGAHYAWGVPLEVDADTRTVTGSLGIMEPVANLRARFVSKVIATERIPQEDVVVLEDSPDHYAEAPGLRFACDIRFLLDAFNRKAVSRDELVGILGSFGRLPVRGGRA